MDEKEKKEIKLESNQQAEKTKETERIKESFAGETVKAPQDFFVDGFFFSSYEDANIAQQEYHAVNYLKNHMNHEDTEMLLRIYNNAIKKRTFQTPIGLSFLYQLRIQLLEKKADEKDLLPISIYVSYTSKLRANTQPARRRVEPIKKSSEKMDKYKISILLNGFLILLVGFMFFIALNSKNPNILNYQKAIVNKYSAWEEELSQRESAVREKELEQAKENIQ